MKPLSYGRQQITTADIEAVTRAMQADYLSGGPEIEAFEREFAAYIGATEAIAVANGTAALHLCALALDVQPGQRWLLSPLTFAATAHCIRYCGAEVEFVDIDPATGLIDLDQLAQRLAEQPPGTYHGVLPVAYAGLPVDLPRLQQIIAPHGLRIIEDACHAPGGATEAFRCGDGQYADLSIFSFHPVKHLTTGEGGMVTTRDPHLARRIRNLRTHGIERDRSQLPAGAGGWYYEIQELGYNCRLSAIQAALGRSQLTRAAANLSRRREIAAWYQQHLADLPLTLPATAPGHAWHLYVVRSLQRRALYEFLRQQQIFTQVHYVPLNQHPYYDRAAQASGPLPHADAFYEQCLSLPMYPDLSEEDLLRVRDALRRFFQASRRNG